MRSGAPEACSLSSAGPALALVILAGADRTGPAFLRCCAPGRAPRPNEDGARLCCAEIIVGRLCGFKRATCVGKGGQAAIRLVQRGLGGGNG